MFYSWGEDCENTGVLGLGEVTSQAFPTTPLIFIDKRLKFIHCGEKHAAAIDSTYLLIFYKQNKKIFKIKEGFIYGGLDSTENWGLMRIITLMSLNN